MQSSDVSITDLGGGGAYGSDSEFTPDMFPEGSLMQTKVAFEAQKRDSIMKALRDIPGVRVEVNADFDSTLEETTNTVKPDTKTAAERESTSEEKSSQMTADNGGATGLRAQGPGRTGTSQGPQPKNQSETTSKTTDTNYRVGVTTSSVRKTGFTPKEVWATVTIPSSYIESLWKARNPTATTPPKPEELGPLKNEAQTKVEEIVEPLVRLQVNSGQNQIKYVRVAILDSLPVPEIVPPSFTTTATSWIGQYWSTLGMLGVAMFSLLILRSVVNGKPSDTGDTLASADPGLKLHTEEPMTSNESAEEPQSDRPRLRLKKGKSLKDDLVEIVREDPDAAADILRSWIGKAG